MLLLLRSLLPLLAVVVLTAAPSLSLTPRPSDGSFRGWSVSGLAAHPLSPMVYAIEGDYAIRAINGTSGHQVGPLKAVTDGYISTLSGLVVSTDTVYGMVLTMLLPSYTLNYTLSILTVDLKDIGAVNLNSAISPSLAPGIEFLFDTMLTDSTGSLYLFHQMGNNSVMVHVLSGGKQIDWWMAPIPTNSSYQWAFTMGPGDLLYFMPWVNAVPQTLYIVSTGGVLSGMLTLNVTATPIAADEYMPAAIAVSPLTGNIAITVNSGVNMFDGSSGAMVSSFAYYPALSPYNDLEWMCFDLSGRLLVSDYFNELAVQILSAKYGDVLATWNSVSPSLFDIWDMVYEPSADSLLAFPFLQTQLAVRLDASTGFLLQEYPVSGRLDQCYSFAAAMGDESGDFYRLFYCVGEWPLATVRLAATSQAGQLRRVVTLPGMDLSTLQGALLVCEDLGMFYLVSFDSSGQSMNQVMAFAFNGTNLFNYTDPRIGNLGAIVNQLVRVDQKTLAVVDAYTRIALLDLNTGALFGNISMPETTFLLTAMYDGKSNSWFRSELTQERNGVSVLINQYNSDNGGLIAQYSFDPVGFLGSAVMALAIDQKGQRLFASQTWYLGASSGAISWWKIQAADGAQAINATRGAVPLVRPSGVRAMQTESAGQGEVAGRRGGRRADKRPSAVAGIDTRLRSVKARGESLAEAMTRRGVTDIPQWVRQLSAKPSEAS